VIQAESYIDDYFVVLNPNHFDAHEILEPMINKLKKSGADLVLSSIETSEPWNYGVFVLDGDGKPKGIVEKPEKGKEPSNIRVVGVYLLSKKFFDYHKNVKHHHYSFEDALDAMLKKEKAEMILTSKKTPSLKYPWHLLDFAKQLIDENFEGQKISEDAQISEKAEIIGDVVVEEGARIMENAVIKGPVYIGKNTIIGNNSLVRDYAVIEDNVVVGANAEVTRSIFMDGVHVHSGFFGDTILGENTKVGAGTVFANVRLDRENIKAIVKGKKVDTGRRKLGGVVGNNTSIGINCSIMPGKLIGNNVFIGPASVVDENIPSNTKYFTKFEKVIKND
jgi:bifunctional UDP-N-acetylglucosamine pyrophosphorylase/glucosamine-1-phosphate N-acetyltransferase